MVLPNDPLDLIAGVLANLYLRFVLFFATVLAGPIVANGLLGLGLVPVGLIDIAGIGSFMATALVALVTVVTLATTESATWVCVALAINLLAWCNAGIALAAIMQGA